MLRATIHQAVGSLLCLLVPVGAGLCATVGEPETKPKPALAAWDTGKSSDKSLTPANLAEKDRWTQVPVNETLDSFKGDAVLSNGRVTVAVRKRGTAAEVYSEGVDGASERCQLLLLTANGDPAVRLDHVKLTENGKGAVTLHVSYQT